MGANIAEAWAKRRYKAHFISKLTDADGEQYETQHWMETALDCAYLDQQIATELIERCRQIGRLLGGMMEKADIFCGNPPKTLREEDSEYEILPTSDTD